MTQLVDPNPSQGFFVSATEKMLFGSLTYLPKKNIQLFAQVHRYKIPSNIPPSYFNRYFHQIVHVSSTDFVSKRKISYQTFFFTDLFHVLCTSRLVLILF